MSESPFTSSRRNYLFTLVHASVLFLFFVASTHGQEAGRRANHIGNRWFLQGLRWKTNVLVSGFSNTIVVHGGVQHESEDVDFLDIDSSWYYGRSLLNLRFYHMLNM
jgi:hypothetical protein